ncbi:DUF2165 family protein [Streptomyces sp. TRM43335]|uniref:DUF2165 family protein n=1 Tax=Streptomyces taklimakanensis TaxID=2569853 RepID=A0A6G2B6F7_9ACTN|nr:DUF2165 domain-containing protein [Streptomyces taklimakanensis]MTE17855.1 DUF2165 family protein [Streptomyces taklimakanensis]
MAGGEGSAGNGSGRPLSSGALPVAATALTGTVAVYMALVAFGNITDFDTNREFVRHVLAMDTTFRDPDLMWRAIESPALQDAAYVAIIAWETLTALVLLLATWLWVASLRDGGHERARRAATLGLTMVLLLFGLGFFAIGGEWFAMWQSSDWNGLDAAARNVVLAGLALVVVNLPSRRGDGRRPAGPASTGTADGERVP